MFSSDVKTNSDLQSHCSKNANDANDRGNGVSGSVTLTATGRMSVWLPAAVYAQIYLLLLSSKIEEQVAQNAVHLTLLLNEG